MDRDTTDKHWAKAYLLDPLTAPEPSQETGPGSSHYNALRSLSPPIPRSHSQRRPPHIRIPSESSTRKSQQSSSYPTPPGSDSPNENSLHSSNPYSKLSASPKENISPPNSPPQRGSPPNRPGSAQFYRDPNTTSVKRSASTRTYNSPNYNRRSALPERYPGDMSSQPLEMLKQSNRAAERSHYTRHRPRQASETDIIDALDTIGGTYHHGGPYDATLLSRNMKKKYSPVAAVADSNREALRATPREFIQDSLQKHRPLQGTAIIPPGERDMNGYMMQYEEGADLMREPDAPGGPYRRWGGRDYHPDDLKGKGEPSFSIDRDAKKKRDELDHLLGSNEYELQSGVNRRNTTGHRRTDTEPRAMASGVGLGENDGVNRRNSTGKRLTDGLKRRFGSLRGRKEIET